MRRSCLAIAVALLCSCGQNNVTHDPDAISAGDLVRQHADNAIAFKRDYGERRVKIGGTVSGVELEEDRPVLVLKAGVFSFLYCYFDEPEGLESLRPGQTVCITGTVKFEETRATLVSCQVVTAAGSSRSRRGR